MRLDHLLSKETSKMAKAHLSNVLRSVQGTMFEFRSNVIQFRGYRKNVPKQQRIPYGGLAQLGERLPCKQEVTGSIPVLSTKEVLDMGQ